MLVTASISSSATTISAGDQSDQDVALGLCLCVTYLSSNNFVDDFDQCSVGEFPISMDRDSNRRLVQLDRMHAIVASD